MHIRCNNNNNNNSETRVESHEEYFPCVFLAEGKEKKTTENYRKRCLSRSFSHRRQHGIHSRAKCHASVCVCVSVLLCDDDGNFRKSFKQSETQRPKRQKQKTKTKNYEIYNNNYLKSSNSQFEYFRIVDFRHAIWT